MPDKSPPVLNSGETRLKTLCWRPVSSVSFSSDYTRPDKGSESSNAFSIILCSLVLFLSMSLRDWEFERSCHWLSTTSESSIIARRTRQLSFILSSTPLFDIRGSLPCSFVVDVRPLSFFLVSKLLPECHPNVSRPSLQRLEIASDDRIPDLARLWKKRR